MKVLITHVETMIDLLNVAAEAPIYLIQNPKFGTWWYYSYMYFSPEFSLIVACERKDKCKDCIGVRNNNGKLEFVESDIVILDTKIATKPIVNVFSDPLLNIHWGRE